MNTKKHDSLGSVLLIFKIYLWHAGSEFLDQGLNSCTLKWKHGVLTTGPPGKAQLGTFSNYLGFPGGSDSKESASISGLGISPLEKEMATHPSILAWRIPWTEKPGRLKPMGSQGVGHD